ncbi:unnamed protein product [Prorocentrum cordatum]|uniref:Subtilisin n=1 Tax=Prorocentrum cordatum TaxID=2364126 RepID=A0ABN9V2M6_9DINO|nr:unnamed protein product [Polarella glacialis]
MPLRRWVLAAAALSQPGRHAVGSLMPATGNVGATPDSCAAPGGCSGGGGADEVAHVQLVPARIRRRAYPMCSLAATLCNGGAKRKDGKLHLSQLEHALASKAALRYFLIEAGLHSEVEADPLLSCEELCHAAVDILRAAGVEVPNAPDLGCYPVSFDEDGRGNRTKCDYDMSPASIMALSADHTGGIPSHAAVAGTSVGGAVLLSRVSRPRGEAAEVTAMQQRRGAGAGGPRPRVPEASGFEATADNQVDHLALRILYVFRVYPDAWVTYAPYDSVSRLAPGHTDPWTVQVARNNMVSRAYLNAAILKLAIDPEGTKPFLNRWFGTTAHEDSAVHRELLRIINAIAETVNTATIVYSSENPMCQAGMYAFVYSFGDVGVPMFSVPGAMMGPAGVATTPAGSNIVTLCDYYFAYPSTAPPGPDGFASHGIWESVQTFIHESSHHRPAFLTDVCTNPNVSYVHVRTSHLEALQVLPRISTSNSAVLYTLPGTVVLQLVNQSISGDLSFVRDDETNYFAMLDAFSEDGSYTRLQIMTESCAYPACHGFADLGYGEKTCIELARRDPYKALLNADSFGYFIVEAAEAFFTDQASAAAEAAAEAAAR